MIHRICKTERKLNSTFYQAKTVYHLSIDSNRLEFSELKVVVDKYLAGLRKQINPATHSFYKILYVRVFDIGKKNFKKTGKYNFHYHVALLFEKINPHHFIEISHKLLENSEAVFNNIGWRNKSQVFHYFAKRAAGEYGHGKNLYYLQDLIDLKTFFEKYSNRRFLTFSKGLLVYKSGKEREGFLCPICKKPMEYLGSEAKHAIHGLDPPQIILEQRNRGGLNNYVN